MDRPHPREIVFCHQCENEWYRDENGLQCPDCQSEFTEIVEGGNDPRAQEQEAAQTAAINHPLHDHNPWDAPDPDEEDIDHFQWNRAPPGEFGGQRYHATFNRTYNMGAGGQAQGQAGGAGGAGLLGMIGNIVGGLLQQPPQQQGHEHGQHGHDHADEHAQGQGNDGSNRGVAATSPPGSPNNSEQAQGRPGVFTRHIHGPGYSFTMTATSSNNLSPRNANGPQPYNAQPQDMDDLMQQMFNNIGAFPPLHPQGQDHVQRGPNGGHVFPATLLQLLNTLGGPAGGVHGDAVYSQEALDRIVSQLMEQHQTGNAPGPASESAIKSLPRRSITEADAGDSGTADCSVCMDSVPVGDSVTVLPCSHWFHHDCIRAWLGEHDTCPHCRKGIMPADSNGTAEGPARESSQAPLHDQHAQQPPPGSSGGGGASGSSSSAGVFSRMRDAFGSGSRAPPPGDSST
ncbi:hypothetical protein Q7P37_000157 [Cladosporium fusiforme]